MFLPQIDQMNAQHLRELQLEADNLRLVRQAHEAETTGSDATFLGGFTRQMSQFGERIQKLYEAPYNVRNNA